MSIRKSLIAVIATFAFIASVLLPGATATADTPIEIDANCTGLLEWGVEPQSEAVSFVFDIDEPAEGGTETEISNDFENFTVEDQECLPRTGWTVTSSLTAFENGAYHLEADLTIQTQVAVDMGVVWVNGLWNSGYTFVYTGDHNSGGYAAPPQVAQTPSVGFDETLDGRGTTEFIAPPYAGNLPISITINDLLTVADGEYTGTLTFTLAAKV